MITISRMKVFSFLLLALFSTAQLSVNAQSKTGTLADVSFIQGMWRGNFSGGPINGGWTAAEGDNIVGFLRMMKDEKVTLYEIFAFEQTEKGPVAHVKHFKPGLISLEEKEISDTYNFIESTKNTATFEKDDASVRIIYELRSKNQLVFQRGIPENGKWVFKDLFIFDRLK